MMKLIKNGEVYSPDYLGKKDILLAGTKIVHIADSIEPGNLTVETIDAGGKLVLPGFIDQHIHLTGAGGKRSFASMTPEIAFEELIKCGSTTVMGVLGTDGVTRSLEGLYAKVKALDQQGISAYMLTGYFAVPTSTMLGSIQEDMIFIDKVIGCKTAISDERSSFPTTNELLKMLREVHVGGLISGKGGILHVHVGALQSGIKQLIELVENYNFPIRHISPTHVGRTRELFNQSIQFAKMGGMIDISTGGSKFDEPYKQVLYALENGVSIHNITFSSDGNAGMARKSADGKQMITYKAPVDKNFNQVKILVQEAKMDLSDAFRIITSNPASNLSLKHKGSIEIGKDADLCLLDKELNLCDVIANGHTHMKNGDILIN